MSFNLLAYDMARTHSIMRIATTASPVSGAAIRGRMAALAMEAQWKTATNALTHLINLRLYPGMKKRLERRTPTAANSPGGSLLEMEARLSPGGGSTHEARMAKQEQEEGAAATYPEEWEARMSGLLLDFPTLKKSEVVEALVEKKGHADEAAVILHAKTRKIEARTSKPGGTLHHFHESETGKPE